MPEWSKEVDSSPIIFVCLGSNPSCGTVFFELLVTGTHKADSTSAKASAPAASRQRPGSDPAATAMPERSKGADLRSVGQYDCAGSNPAGGSSLFPLVFRSFSARFPLVFRSFSSVGRASVL